VYALFLPHMNQTPEAFHSLPAVGKLLQSAEVKALIGVHGKELILFSLRRVLDHYRMAMAKGATPPDHKEFLETVHSFLARTGARSLKKVVNATGVVIHTNLGRAPLGTAMLKESFDLLTGYNNLEFDLQTGQRGDRNVHAAELLKFLTGAEDVVVVNNNAAAVMLVLRAFAKGREVPVSRGELIEIGGSFRIPDIMAASDCKMVEVGTTNKTRLSDYSKAISKKTGLLFKAHKSNYVIKGFTEEVSLKDLSELGKKAKIPVLFDLGSGLLRAQNNPLFAEEPDVKQTLESGVDLVCFSGDKLLGGPQAGIIVGKKELIARLKKEPMLRALRVDKVTLALLESACLSYLNEKDLKEKNPVFNLMNRPLSDIRKAATRLCKELEKEGIMTEITESTGQCGGGTLPDAEIKSLSVKIIYTQPNKLRSAYAERMMEGLLHHEYPVLPVLKQGNIYFDMLCVFEDEIPQMALSICEANKKSLVPCP